MPNKNKIIITFNPVDSSIYDYMDSWRNYINDENKKRLEKLRAERKAKIKEIFKNI
jgi:hypothetical protein